MNQYKEYSLEDFVLDAQFQRWVRFKRSSDVAFWQKFKGANPQQLEQIIGAQALLESVYTHFETDVDDAEIDIEIHELLNKVRASKKNRGKTAGGLSLNSLRKNYLLWAAAVLIMAMGACWLYYSFRKQEGVYDKMISGRQFYEEINETTINKVVELTDGSKVILYPDSRISFPKTFVKDRREVFLSGGALFQVSKDPKRPFLVYANELVTEVLGTTFAVNAPSDATKKTTVEVTEGKVSVFKNTEFSAAKNQKILQSKGLVLLPNQKVVFERESSNLVKTLRENPEVVESGPNPTSFDFNNVPASIVLADLKDAYQVDIIFDKELLQGCPVTASLSRQSLFEKLDIICEVIEAHYEMLDGRIVVYSKGCKI